MSSGHVRSQQTDSSRAAASDDEDESDVEANDNTASDVKERRKKEEEQEYEEEEEKEAEKRDGKCRSERMPSLTGMCLQCRMVGRIYALLVRFESCVTL